MSSIRLYVLAFFEEFGEAHGYQVRRKAEEQHVHLWTDISIGSVHGAIRRLTAEGLLRVVRVEREGNRPERQICDITPAGRTAVTGLRRDALLHVHMPADPFDLGLTRLDPDTLPGLTQQLAERLRRLEALLRAVTAQNAAAKPFLSLSETYAVGHREHTLRAEVDWMRGVVGAAPAIIADERAPRSGRSTP